MRKVIGLMAVVVALALMLTACGEVKTGNRVVSGSDVQTFTYAYIALGGERLIHGYITQWRDYDNSDVVQVMIDGKYYLTHYSNVVMVADPAQGGLNYSNSSLWGVEE